MSVARAEGKRHRSPSPETDALVLDARRSLAEQKIAQAISRALEAAPPLTDEQRRRLASLLAPFVGAA